MLILICLAVLAWCYTAVGYVKTQTQMRKLRKVWERYQGPLVEPADGDLPEVREYRKLSEAEERAYLDEIRPLQIRHGYWHLATLLSFALGVILLCFAFSWVAGLCSIFYVLGIISTIVVFTFAVPGC